MIDKILGIKYPIIQGGMANIATGEFAAAVCNAGGLGLIAAGGMTAEMLREHIQICKSKANLENGGKFGVNLMLMNPEADKMAEVIVEEGVKIVTTGAGMPTKYMKAWKEAGIFVMPVVSSTLMAKKMVADGADMIIAEGCESGGHVGEMTTMALIPQMVEALNVPVIAAGGIASGKQMAAAFALGAQGVQIGTVLLATEECPIHENYKAAVLKAKEYIKKEKAGADKMELEVFTLGSLRRAVFDGDTKTGSLMAGQVAGQLHEIKTIASLFEEMVGECKAVCKGLTGMWE